MIELRAYEKKNQKYRKICCLLVDSNIELFRFCYWSELLLRRGMKTRPYPICGSAFHTLLLLARFTDTEHTTAGPRAT